MPNRRAAPCLHVLDAFQRRGEGRQRPGRHKMSEWRKMRGSLWRATFLRKEKTRKGEGEKLLTRGRFTDRWPTNAPVVTSLVLLLLLAEEVLQRCRQVSLV